MTEDLLASVRAYYEDRIRTFGPTPRGVDWNTAESQTLRFRQLLRVCDRRSTFSVIDYGCGYGALADYLEAEGCTFDYTGLDVCPAMVAVALERNRGRAGRRFLTDESGLAAADYALASGVFNVKLENSDEDWRRYVFATLDRLNALARRGFAFNCLTRYADRERMRPDLHYADPTALFDRCKTRFSAAVALLHDYPLYEFTILVRKDGGEG